MTKEMISERILAVERDSGATADLAPNLALPWVVRLRYGMVAGEAALLLAMFYGFRVSRSFLWTLAPLALTLISNALLSRLKTLPFRFPQQTLGAVFCLDILCLTVILGLTGGTMNPFSLLYLVQITLSAVVLRKVWTRALGALSAVCFGLLFFFYVPSAAFQMHHVEQGISPHLVGMWIAFVVAVTLITFFTGKIADSLRTREQEVSELRDQVSKNDRLASLVTLAAGAAHELGTPLGTIAVVARELERYAATIDNRSAVLQDAKLIRSEVDRCCRILEQMSVRSAEPLGETPTMIRLRDLLTQVTNHFSEANRELLTISLDSDSLCAILPRKATTQSLVALVQNALDANVERRPIRMSARAEGSELQISIEDRGEGMATHVLRRIAEPFFTTKEPGKGMGLGTFLVSTFAERLGGRVVFDSKIGEGTTVTLLLPLAAGEKIREAV